MKRVLHIVNKSPAEENALAACLRTAKPGDGILLLEDGVLAALSRTDSAAHVAEQTGGLNLYALEPDIAARGLADRALLAAVERVDYAGFVDLVTRYDITQSWF